MRAPCNWVDKEMRKEAVQFILTEITGATDYDSYSSIAADCQCSIEDYLENRFWNILDEEFRGIPELEVVAEIFQEKIQDLAMEDVRERSCLFGTAQRILEEYLAK